MSISLANILLVAGGGLVLGSAVALVIVCAGAIGRAVRSERVVIVEHVEVVVSSRTETDAAGDSSELERPLVLKNGATERRVVVFFALQTLHTLYRKEPAVFRQLVSKYRDPGYELSAEASAVLDDYGLIVGDGGEPRELLRNTALSAVEGEGEHMVLGSPVAI